MAGLTLERALKATTTKLVMVGGMIYELRPAGLYSMSDMVRLNVLLRHRARVLHKKAECHVDQLLADLVLCDDLPPDNAEQVALLVTMGLEFLSETTEKGGKSGGKSGGGDVGQTLAELQVAYHGDPRAWWDMPLYQVQGYGQADLRPERHKETTMTADAFTAFMGASGGLN